MSVQTVQLRNGATFKLGRIRPKAPPPALRFAVYYDPLKDRVPPPQAVDYSAAAAASLSRVYLNDQEGDCVIAGKYHALGVWTGNESGSSVVATDAEVQASYHTICGPGDNGCVITDVLDYYKSKGLTASGKGYKIDGYVSIDFKNQQEVMVALEVFGALVIGINLPNDWTAAGPGVVWDVTRSQIVGGHDVTAIGYTQQGVQISTWGKVGTIITWAAMAAGTWVEELYAVLSPDWYSQADLAPNGIDAATLAADLAKLGGGVIPDPGPGPGPSPVPPAPVPPAPVPSWWTWLVVLAEQLLKELGVMALPLIEGLVAKLPLPAAVIAEIDALIEAYLGIPAYLDSRLLSFPGRRPA